MKVVLVIGRSQGTWEQVDAANALVRSACGDFDEVVAVNEAGCDYPPVTHWVSFHADQFEKWQLKRRANGFKPAKLWTSTYGRKESAYEKQLGRLGIIKVDYTGGGSSGLVAVIVAVRHLSATHAILAGMPMDVAAGHYDKPGPWLEADRHRKAWSELLFELQSKVRSMSGWTAEQLGYPDEKWLIGGIANAPTI